MKNKIFFINKIIISILISLLIVSNAKSEIIKNIEINGNERVSDQTVIIFSNLKIGDNINTNDLNISLKEIYNTNYFEDVQISFFDGTVKINVKENPIIQSIKINGIKKNNILEKIEEVTSKIEKYPFIRNQVNEQVIFLKNILKSYGYYFVELETSITSNDNNTVDLIYNFKLGEVAKISKINFIGNKVFRDNTLRNVIISEESKFWKFITRNKFVDSNRIKADVSRLINFYQNRGYFDVSIKSTTAIINEEKQFELIFNIDSGNKFYFNNFDFTSTDNLPIESIEKFKKNTVNLKGKRYSKKIINDLIDNLNEFTLRNEFVFINAKYDEIVITENKIDVVIKFDELEKNFVERINILGNFITDEKVIRNSLIIDEGDPYNDILFDRSIQNLKAKNIFKSVKYSAKKNKSSNKIIDIEVEEKPTGEIFAGAGTGTTGSTLTAGIKENNYLGLGIVLDTNFTITDDTLKGKFSVLNPNYDNSDKSLKTSIENSTNDLMTSSGYKTNRLGFAIGTEFEQMSDFYVNLETSVFYEDLETSSKANKIVKRQEGNYFENLISYSLSYNKLNQNYQPSDGFINKFSQTLPLISDDASLENSFTSSLYHSIGENLILSANLYLKTINSIDDNVRISKRVFIPTRRLKGFEGGKIGPKDGTEYIGGNYATALNLNSTLPNLIFENENIDFNFFIDMANVWEVDYDSSLDSNKIRSSTGISVNWYSAIGPLTFSYAIPLSEAETDITEKFRFQIGTSF